MKSKKSTSVRRGASRGARRSGYRFGDPSAQQKKSRVIQAPEELQPYKKYPLEENEEDEAEQKSDCGTTCISCTRSGASASSG